MTLAMPAVIVFGAVTWLLLRTRAIRALEAVIVTLFGFFLASSGVGKAVGAFLSVLFSYHTKQPPPPPGGNLPV